MTGPPIVVLDIGASKIQCLVGEARERHGFGLDSLGLGTPLVGNGLGQGTRRKHQRRGLGRTSLASVQGDGKTLGESFHGNRAVEAPYGPARGERHVPGP